MLEGTGDPGVGVGRWALRKCSRRVGVVVLALAVMGAGGLASGASAAVFNVKSTADNTAPCSGSGPFSCPSLRSAVIASNTAGGSNTINVPAGTYRLSIGPSGADDATTGDLNLTANVTIKGAGAATGGTKIVGNGDRVFDIVTPSATLSGMAITGGSQQLEGGAIDDTGSALTLISDLLNNNTTAPKGFGGGVAMLASGSATLTVSNTTFRSDIAADTGPDFGGFGGAVYFGPGAGTMTVTNSTFASNTAQSGTVDQGGFGGAISFEPNGSASLSITGSTFSSNTAAGGSSTQGGFGGAIDFEPAGGGPFTLSITNSTLFGNKAGGPSGFGGAIDFEPSGPASATLTQVTVVGNSVNKAQQGAGLDIEDAPMTIRNSIVSGNKAAGVADNCAPSSGGTIVRGGHNIEQGTTCGFDINANPLLGPLSSNGGPTQTMALLKGSPAIDKGLPALCPPTDQRGVKRPDRPGTACDLGAYESGSRLAPPHGTRIYKRKINSSKHAAKFWFRAKGKVKGFRCELRTYVAKKHSFAVGKWKHCSSPHGYTHLKRGRYLFEVRAYNAGGPDKKPAMAKFKI